MSGSGLVVVSGAAGAVGGAVAEALRTAGWQVRGVDLRPASQGVDEMLVGDCGDEEFALRAVEGASALVHLAAQPSPDRVRPARTFMNNVPASFALCHAAAEQGISRIVAASSISILGMAYGPDESTVPYVPVDDRTPLQIADTYALSKGVDELTLGMITRHFGTTTVALRMPFVATGEVLNGWGRAVAADPASRVRELWSYIDTRDAARAFVQALDAELSGAHVLTVAAAASLGSVDVERLLAEYLPQVEIRHRIRPGRTAYATALAEQRIGFASQWCWCGGRLALEPLPGLHSPADHAA
jgi:nucleoside-diphosphate-sugar epimerase